MLLQSKLSLQVPKAGAPVVRDPRRWGAEFAASNNPAGRSARYASAPAKPGPRRALGRAFLSFGAIFVCLWLWQGCSGYQPPLKLWSKKQPAPAPKKEEQKQAAEPPQENNSFLVHIEYAEKRDFLRSLSIVEYQRAHLLMARQVPGGHMRSLVRFGGGTTIWQIEPKPVKRTLLSRASPFSVLSTVPVANVNGDLRVKAVAYGRLPRGLIQTLPGTGPPDPLEAGNYYVVKVERAFGVTNFQIVRLDANGEILVYDADPRAGDSYELCCDVSQAFFAPVGGNQEEQRAAGDVDTGEGAKPPTGDQQQTEPPGPASR